MRSVPRHHPQHAGPELLRRHQRVRGRTRRAGGDADSHADADAPRRRRRRPDRPTRRRPRPPTAPTPTAPDARPPRPHAVTDHRPRSATAALTLAASGKRPLKVAATTVRDALRGARELKVDARTAKRLGSDAHRRAPTGATLTAGTTTFTVNLSSKVKRALLRKVKSFTATLTVSSGPVTTTRKVDGQAVKRALTACARVLARASQRARTREAEGPPAPRRHAQRAGERGAADVALRYVRANLSRLGLDRDDLETLQAADHDDGRRASRPSAGARRSTGSRPPTASCASTSTRDGRVLNVLGEPAHDLRANTTPAISAGEAVRAVQAATGSHRALAAQPGRRARARRTPTARPPSSRSTTAGSCGA